MWVLVSSGIVPLICKESAKIIFFTESKYQKGMRDAINQFQVVRVNTPQALTMTRDRTCRAIFF